MRVGENNNLEMMVGGADGVSWASAGGRVKGSFLARVSRFFWLQRGTAVARGRHVKCDEDGCHVMLDICIAGTRHVHINPPMAACLLHGLHRLPCIGCSA